MEEYKQTLVKIMNRSMVVVECYCFPMIYQTSKKILPPGSVFKLGKSARINLNRLLIDLFTNFWYIYVCV